MLLNGQKSCREVKWENGEINEVKNIERIAYEDIFIIAANKSDEKLQAEINGRNNIK